MNTKGTPKTLNEAIENGLLDKTGYRDTATIEKHVIDFLAQRFGTELVQAVEGSDTQITLQRLWNSIRSGL